MELQKMFAILGWVNYSDIWLWVDGKLYIKKITYYEWIYGIVWTEFDRDKILKNIWADWHKTIQEDLDKIDLILESI